MKKTKVMLTAFAVFAAFLMLMTTSMAISERKEVKRPDFKTITIIIDPGDDPSDIFDDILDDMLDALDDFLEENGLDDALIGRIEP